ncbi:hypothetical protein V6N13_080441 [Hibiscus sabdariffa]|uniref:Uncharacterized protein n=1 Tax=Hibiscus sabdariffa TaxID=183260 RepID=A0ABR2PYB8_9ROSI
MQSFVSVPTSRIDERIITACSSSLWPINSCLNSQDKLCGSLLWRLQFELNKRRNRPQGQAISCLLSLLRDTYCLFQNSGNGLKQLWF